jgi:superfamily I DNA/RNA helicase
MIEGAVTRKHSGCSADCVLLTGGPGTGKSLALAKWVSAHITDNKADPREILIISFTQESARQVARTLTGLAGEQARAVWSGTFAALSFRFLGMMHTGLETVYDAAGREAILRYLFPGLKEAAVRKLVGSLGRYFETGDTAGYEDLEDIASTYRQYTAYCKGVDFSDLVRRTISIWEKDPDGLEEIRKRFQYIAIDDLQDINPLQYRFLRMLGDGKCVFGTGDPEQALFETKGSDPKLIFRFREEFRARSSVLGKSHRLRGRILAASAKIIRPEKARNPGSPKASRPGGERIRLFAARDAEAEARFIVSEIQKLHDSGLHQDQTLSDPDAPVSLPYSGMAILYRKHSVSVAIVRRLIKEGIPVCYGDGTSFSAHPPFCILADVLRMYLNPRDIVSLHSLLHQAMGWEELRLRRLFRILNEAEYSLLDPLPKGIPRKDRNVVEKFRTFYAALPEIFLRESLPGALSAIFAQYIPDRALSPVQILRKEVLMELAQSTQAHVAYFLELITLSPYTDAGNIPAERVCLLNFHAARGLEFPVVFIAGAEEGITPSLRPDANLAEERRLFYVAMTRPRDMLYVSYAAKRTMSGKELECLPSRFVKEIPRGLVRELSRRKEAIRLPQLSLFS